ncbi:hypothetical protein [Actinomadura violacea]|uniref:DUF4190 domain-containing protein n=1 Tax=Actinomadura violacea TaxID=2819934 RepID=A0ABS3RHD6_9ACTN|nr:hypothetical protein [Actinomadura violacea]MBO2456140.1 hypothetical protein [Actinomadura violacea]
MANAQRPPRGLSPAIRNEIRSNPATFIVGVPATVAGVLALSLGRLLIMLLFAILVVVWLLPLHPGLRQRKKLRFALPGALTVALAAGVAVFVILNRPAHLAFKKTEGPVPPCAAFKGTGTIPDGKKLLVFDREVTSSGLPIESGGYYFDGFATPTDDGWFIDDVEIGRDATYDFHAEVTAVLGDAEKAEGYSAEHPSPQSRLNLPLPAFASDGKTSIRVHRNKAKGGC